MKWPSLNTILLIAVAVFITLQLKSCFDKTPPNEKLIKADIQIEQLEKQRLADSIELKQSRGKIDSLISLSDQRLSDLENKKQPIINVIKKIPVIVDNFDREQLHSGAESY